jgi:exodeoxyribonuclease V beta subunit
VTFPPFQPSQVPLPLPADKRRLLIEASAGTGKTYNLAEVYERLVSEQRLAVDRILVTTFTDAATSELRFRLRRRLYERVESERAQGGAGDSSLVAHLEEQLRNFDLAAVHTIHGFCQRTLTTHAFETGMPFAPQFVEADDALKQEIAADLFGTHFYAASPDTAAVANASVGIGGVLGLVKQYAYTPRVEPTAPVLDDAERARRNTEADALFAQARAHAGFSAAAVQDARDTLLGMVADGKCSTSAANQKVIASIDPLCDALALVIASTSEADIPAASLQYLLTKSPWEAHFLKAVLKKHLPAGGSLNLPALEVANLLVAAFLRRADARAGLGGGGELRRLLWPHVKDAWESVPRRKGELAFGHLLTRLEASANNPMLRASIKRSYDFVMLDEFQDTDPVQSAIFDSLFAEQGVPVLCVGDPKQSIYGFRGADVFAYLRTRDSAQTLPFGLMTNWRSSPKLVATLNALYAAAPTALGEDEGDGGATYVPVQAAPNAQDRLQGRAPVEVVWVGEEDGLRPATRGTGVTKSSDAHWMGMVARDIAALLSDGQTTLDGQPVRPGQVAVLVRSNREAAAAQLALRQLNIPSVRRGAESVLASGEAAELGAILNAIAAPKDRRALKAAMVTSVVGLRGDDLLRMREDEALWEQHARLFADAAEQWEQQGFLPAMARLLATCGGESKLLAHADGERRLTNFRHLIELLTREAQGARVGPSRLAQRFAELQQSAATGDKSESLVDPTELRIERDADAVQVMTIHKSKGLEFDVVYCPSLLKLNQPNKESPPFVYHDREQDSAAVIELGDKTDDGVAEGQIEQQREGLGESGRLLYVALTRARQLLVMHVCRQTTYHKACVAHLLHGTGGGRFEEVAKVLKELDSPLAHDAVAQHAQAVTHAGGSMSVRGPEQRELFYVPSTADDPNLLAALTPSQTLALNFRRTSYSGMLHERDGSSWVEHAPPALADGNDQAAGFRDDDDTGRPTPTQGTLTGGAIALQDRVLRRGPDVGTAIHEVYEKVDFQHTADLSGEVGRVLSTLPGVLPRVQPEARVQLIANALGRTLEAPLDPKQPGLSLSALRRRDRIDEMNFHLPVALDHTGEARSAVSAKAIAAALRQPGAPPDVRAYADHAERLGFAAFRGYLTGAVDLVFRWGPSGERPRWYVADYKTNHLGDHAPDYAPERLPAVMFKGHYILQYHLYSLALHRHLRRVLPDYSFDADFGGVYYLFVRGMDPDYGAGHGVYHDRPGEAVIDALDTLFTGGVRGMQQVAS